MLTGNSEVLELNSLPLDMSHYDANAFQLAAGTQTVIRCRRAGCVETVEICLFWFEKED